MDKHKKQGYYLRNKKEKRISVIMEKNEKKERIKVTVIKEEMHKMRIRI